MQRLRRWYAWFIRRAPRFRDLAFIGFSLLTIVAQAASGDIGWQPRDWFVLAAGLVALWWRCGGAGGIRSQSRSSPSWRWGSHTF